MASTEPASLWSALLLWSLWGGSRSTKPTRAVDLDTLTLLLGMMIVVAHLRLSGFLSRATGFIANRAQNPLLLLIAVIGLAGLLSAFPGQRRHLPRHDTADRRDGKGRHSATRCRTCLP